MITKDKIREEVYATLIGALLFIFFGLMLRDLMDWFEAQRTTLKPPTDTNVEAELERETYEEYVNRLSRQHNEDSYPVLECPPTEVRM